MARSPQPWLPRLWAKSHQEGECRIWDGPRNQNGYGVFTWTDDDGQRHSTGAHKAAFLAAGGVLGPRQVVRHVNCHRYLCIEPTHLAPSSQLENIKDREITGTYRRRGGPRPTKGEHQARLEAIQDGITAKEFAAKFGIKENAAFQWMRRWRVKIAPMARKGCESRGQIKSPRKILSEAPQ